MSLAHRSLLVAIALGLVLAQPAQAAPDAENQPAWSSQVITLAAALSKISPIEDEAELAALKKDVCQRASLTCGAGKHLFWSIVRLPRSFWPSWAIYFAVALTIVLLGFQARHRLGLVPAIQFIFPRKVYLSESAKTDYKFFFSMKMIEAFIPLFTVFITAYAIGEFVSAGLDELFGSAAATGPLSFSVRLSYTVGIALAMDLGFYISHYFLHKLPLLWEFHKVHHSVQQLNPFSASRMHLVDMLLNDFFIAVVLGVYNGVFLHFYAVPLEIVTIFGGSFLLFFYGLTGMLRHSHIWLHYGWHLSHILNSPAQHQIHHSKSPVHYDKNFGRIFSFWDWMMGTLYVPRERETIQYGLADDEDVEYQSLVRGCYVLSFVKAARLTRDFWRMRVADR